LEYGIHIISAPNIKSKEDIFLLKEFLASQNVDKMKIMAKIETKEALDNFE
jgi:pyruvate kinase